MKTKFNDSVQMYEDISLVVMLLMMIIMPVICANQTDDASTASTHKSLPSVVITSKPLMFVSSEGPTYTDNNGLIRSLHSRLRNVLSSSTALPTTSTVLPTTSTVSPTSSTMSPSSRRTINTTSKLSNNWINRGSRFLCLTDQECKPLMTRPTSKMRKVEKEVKARANPPTSYYGGESEDPWIELVGMKLPAVPMESAATPPTLSSPGRSPVRNIVRLPSRIRPNPQRPFNTSALHQLHKIHSASHKPSHVSPSDQIPNPNTVTETPSLIIANNDPVVTENSYFDSFSSYDYPSSRPTRSTVANYPSTYYLFTTPSMETPQTPSVPPASQTGGNNELSNIHHTVVFKMLLLIAFIAVPILAATVPFLSPPVVSRRSRDRRDDDAIVDWATDTATLLSLTHLLSDGRLKKLLELSDEEFIETLSGSVSNAVTGDAEDKAHQLKETIQVLLETVKKHLEKNSISLEEDSAETNMEMNSLFMEHLLTKQLLPLQEHVKLMKAF